MDQCNIPQYIRTADGGALNTVKIVKYQLKPDIPGVSVVLDNGEIECIPQESVPDYIWKVLNVQRCYLCGRVNGHAWGCRGLPQADLLE